MTLIRTFFNSILRVRVLSSYEVPEWKRKWCLKKIGSKRKVKEMIRLYESGELSVKEILSKFGLSTPDCLYAFVRKRKRGSYKKKVRITDEVREKVLELRKQGKSIVEIAREVGVSIGSVHRILKEASIS